MKILNQGFDHVEFVVHEISSHRNSWEKLGFEKIAQVSDPSRGITQCLMAQGFVRILLSQYDGGANCQNEMGYQFLQKHGDGIAVLAVDVDDAAAAFAETTQKGARPAMKPQRYETPQGQVCISEIYSPGDFRYRFVERKVSKDRTLPALFLPALVADRMESPSPTGVVRIDHLTNNIDMGQFDIWLNFYKTVFEFKAVRRFNIKTGRTGLLSDVVQSSCGKIKVPINEATEPESQVQEFVNRFKGAGVQHLALMTTDIVGGIRTYRDQGFKFLGVPSTYYEVVPRRVPGVTEDLKVLEELGILLDGEGGGYLMQIFTQELVGPFFLEFIQRKGNDGFGEGNFRALFEAIERDQIARGTLKV